MWPIVSLTIFIPTPADGDSDVPGVSWTRLRCPRDAGHLKARTDELTHLVLDGTLVHTDRVKADRPTSPASIGCTGTNVQVIAGPDGTDSVALVGRRLSTSVSTIRTAAGPSVDEI